MITISIALLLLVLALVLVFWAARGRAPLWPAVLLLVLERLIAFVPLR